MKKINISCITHTQIRVTRHLVFRSLTLLALICLTSLSFISCATSEGYPVFPAPLETTVAAGFPDVFESARLSIKADDRLEMDTIDKAGRFIVREKTRGFIFFQHRTVLDIRLEPVSAEETRITMNMTAEDYEMGGFRRAAGWYPSSDVNTSLGEEVLATVAKRAIQGLE